MNMKWNKNACCVEYELVHTTIVKAASAAFGEILLILQKSSLKWVQNSTEMNQISAEKELK